MGKPEMVALFTAVGFGQWFRYVTGILELTGAVLIMVPRRGELEPRCSPPSCSTRSPHTFSSFTFHPLHRASVSYVRLRRVGTAVIFPAS